VEAVNTAESIIHDTESKMEEFKDQLPADEVARNSDCIFNLSHCYSMGQIIKSLASVCLSVCLLSLLRSQFWVDFDETLHSRLGA